MRHRFFIPSLLVLYAILISTPILYAGYYSDDVPNGLTLGVSQLTHQSIIEIAKNIFLLWFHNGRIFPVAVFTGYPFFYFFHTIASYQIAHVAMIWVSLLSVAWMIKQISKQTTTALLSLCLIPLFWSIRNYHDPLTSFGTLLPLVTIFSTLAVGFFLKAVEEKKWQPYVFSVVAYLLAICTYEIGVSAFVTITLLAWIRKKNVKTFFKDISLFIIVSVLYFALIIYLRHQQSAMVYNGIQLGNFYDFFHTFWYQLTAGLPLSYRLFSDSFTESLFDPYFSYDVQLIPGLLLFLITFLLFAFLLPRNYLNKKTQKFLVFIGGVFVIVPAVLVGISKKYQADISNGVGYLPVYMEYIGFALLLLVLSSYLLSIAPEKYKKIASCVMSLVLSGVVSFSFVLNTRMVHLLNNNWQNARTLVEAALQHGLLEGIPVENVIFQYHHKVWATPEFFMQNAAVNTQVVDLKQSLLSQLPKHAYFMDYFVFPDSAFGYVLLAPLKSIYYQNGNVSYVTITNPKVFLFSGKRKYIMFDGKSVTVDDVLQALNRRCAKRHIVPELQRNEVLSKTVSMITLPKGIYQIANLTHQHGLERK